MSGGQRPNEKEIKAELHPRSSRVVCGFADIKVLDAKGRYPRPVA